MVLGPAALLVTNVPLFCDGFFIGVVPGQWNLWASFTLAVVNGEGVFGLFRHPGVMARCEGVRRVGVYHQSRVFLKKNIFCDGSWASLVLRFCCMGEVPCSKTKRAERPLTTNFDPRGSENDL